MRRPSKILAIVALAAAPALAAATSTPAVFNFDTGSFDSVSGAGSGAQTQRSSQAASSALELPLGVIEQVSVTMIPSIPNPGDDVSIRVDSYSTNLNKASVVWMRNGEVIAQGEGLVAIRFTAPEAGERAVIEMVAQKAEGGTVSKKVTVAPAGLDLMYEPETYAPPFYEGRTRFTNSSRVRLVATPKFVDPDTGREIPADELVYTWRINGSVDQSISGYGRYVADVTGNLVSRGLDVELEAEAVRSSLRARTTLSIEDSQPDIAIYEDHPLYGVLFNRAVDADTERGYPVSSTEVTLLAVPYSMDIRALADPRVKYTWLTDAGFGPNAPTVTFQPPAGSTGDGKVTLRVNHQNFAQYANRAVKLVFGDTGIFPSATASTTTSGSYSL